MAANKDAAMRVGKLERGHECTASVIEVLVEDLDRLALEVNDKKAMHFNNEATHRLLILEDE